jgi:hypothetical protein
MRSSASPGVCADRFMRRYLREERKQVRREVGRCAGRLQAASQTHRRAPASCWRAGCNWANSRRSSAARSSSSATTAAGPHRAACGTPVVVTYAQTNPQHTPWKVPSRVLSREVPCKNCLKSRCPFVDHPCLLGIDEHEVAAAALDLLAEARASRAAADPSTPAARAA